MHRRRLPITYRVLLELGNDLPADRLFTLLRSVDQKGSINGAASELHISYRHAWGLVKAAEERLSCRLLIKRKGGPEGGGAQLTGEAQRLLAQYERFRTQVGPQVEQIFASNRPPAPDTLGPLLLATTIGPADSGIVSALTEAHFKATGTMIRHIAAGSGQSLAIAREGRADLVLVHAPALEAEFMDQGYGMARYPLMHNEFLLVGPDSDPAGVRQARSIEEALQRCANSTVPFLTRGDQSGTHLREAEAWRAAGIDPTGPWYQTCERGSMGSLATLRAAQIQQAHLLIDRATYLQARSERLSLTPLYFGDPALRNEFALIPVSAGRFGHLQGEKAMQFAVWAAGPSGQDLIKSFGKADYGEPLFQPIESE